MKVKANYVPQFYPTIDKANLLVDECTSDLEVETSEKNNSTANIIASILHLSMNAKSVNGFSDNLMTLYLYKEVVCCISRQREGVYDDWYCIFHFLHFFIPLRSCYRSIAHPLCSGISGNLYKSYSMETEVQEV